MLTMGIVHSTLRAATTPYTERYTSLFKMFKNCAKYLHIIIKFDLIKIINNL